MYYRETGQTVKNYSEDRRMVPVREDRWIMWAFLAVMFLVVPFVASDYWFSAILIPMMVLGIASLGLNIATGYTGQLSLRYCWVYVFWCIHCVQLVIPCRMDECMVSIPMCRNCCRVGWNNFWTA